MPVLYKCDASAPSRGVLMTLEILNLRDKFQYIDVNPMLGENRSPEFLKKNPKHSVPVLETEDLIIRDSHVIMTYVVTKYAPESELYPNELNAKCKVDEMLYFESTNLTPKIISSVDSFKKGLKGLTEEQSDALREVYSFLDQFLEETNFLAGDHMTLADVSCISSVASLNFVQPFPEDYKNLKKWFDKLEKEPWFQKINTYGVKLFAEYVDHLKAKKN